MYHLIQLKIFYRLMSMEDRKIYDISPLISEKTAVWPGDMSFRRKVALSLAAGDNIELSSIQTTVHIGAHADAPSHYFSGGDNIAAVSLEPYIGKCQVLTVRDCKLIKPEDFSNHLVSGIKRVLFRTNSSPNPDVFNEDFTAFAPESIDILAESGCVLVGIDTPSVDPFDSKDLPTHHRLIKHNIRNLEGLSLKPVADGIYELIALPLKLANCDASPVRAILRGFE